jgi:hypothetical protein
VAVNVICALIVPQPCRLILNGHGLIPGFFRRGAGRTGKQAVVETRMSSVLVRASAAAAGGTGRRYRRRKGAGNAGTRRQMVTDFEQVTIRELAIDLRCAVDRGLHLGIAGSSAGGSIALRLALNA